MNREQRDSVTDTALEHLLRQAAPRPAPEEADIAAAREALRDDWQHVLRRRQRQRFVVGLAAAATIVVALALSVNLLQAPQAGQLFARIDRSSGPLFVLGESQELKESGDITSLLVGQAIKTGKEGRVGLRLESGASLRVDESSSLSIESATLVRLQQGRIYLDTEPGAQPGSEPLMLTVQTPFGELRHVGTQYMAELRPQQLLVSVREGRVLVEQQSAMAGEQLVSDGFETRRSRIAKHGSLWRWTERLAPVIDVENRRADEFLAWVSRETGLEIAYADAATANNAAATVLSGSIDAPPREALKAWVLAADYTLDIDETDGVIRIGQK